MPPSTVANSSGSLRRTYPNSEEPKPDQYARPDGSLDEHAYGRAKRAWRRQNSGQSAALMGMLRNEGQ